jgi:redox-sensitive bicupin YhaK (pirin superfamily)
MIRNIQAIIPGVSTSDGAGVKLRRSLGGQQQARLDPFLMLDEFSSNDPNGIISIAVFHSGWYIVKGS